MFGPATLTLLSLLLLAGIAERQALLTLFASTLLLAAAVSALWKRYCLVGVEYRRWVSAYQVPFGGTIDLHLEMVNRKPLPLAWLQVRDELPQQMRPLRGRVYPSHRAGRAVLESVLALRPYERVHQRYEVPCDQRGEFELGPVRLASGDLFGLVTQEVERDLPERFIVWPRVVPLSGLGLPPRHPLGDVRTTSWLFEDPTRVAGARDYRPGDPPRRVHWPASVRTQRLQSKVYEPSISRQLVVLLNVHPSEAWTVYTESPDVVELVIVVAASVATWALDAGYQVGLLTNGMHRWGSLEVVVPPAASPGQRGRLLDALARLQTLAARPFEMTLAGAPPALRFGSTLVVVSAALAPAAATQLVRLQRRGHPIVYLHTGPGAAPAPERLRGMVVRRINPTSKWRDLPAVEMESVSGRGVREDERLGASPAAVNRPARYAGAAVAAAPRPLP